MRLTPILGLLSLILAPIGACHADPEATWFTTEQGAIHGLSDGRPLPVLECDRCDVDDPLHRQTAVTLNQILAEFRTNGLPASGEFILRERVEPRFSSVERALEETQAGCSTSTWNPSLTLWRYDLRQGGAEPVFTACLPFLDPVRALRVSCAACDLDRLQTMTSLAEPLREFLNDSRPDSGKLLVTDPSTGGFRRVDFRAYASRVYLGPDRGRTEVVVVGMDSGRTLARSSSDGSPP